MSGALLAPAAVVQSLRRAREAHFNAVMARRLGVGREADHVLGVQFRPEPLLPERKRRPFGGSAEGFRGVGFARPHELADPAHDVCLQDAQQEGGPARGPQLPNFRFQLDHDRSTPGPSDGVGWRWSRPLSARQGFEG